MSVIQEASLNFDFEEIILNVATQISEESGKSITEILDQFVKNISPIADSVAKIYKDGLENNKNEHINYEKELISEFEERLYEVWKSPLDRFNLLIVMCRELGASVNNDFRSEEFEEKTYKLEVLTRMQAHAIHISCEILHLLKGGYADGAMARWRSLHECAVISKIINESSDEIAEKYYYHKHIDDYKFSLSYSEHSESLGFESIDNKSLEIISNKHDELVKKYGTHYANDYGWAVDVIGKKKVNFYDLEAFSGLGYLRPYYKFSSIRVHLGSKSLDYKLSLSLSEEFGEEELLMAGPSNEGLIEPMQCSALSLIDVTLMSLVASKSVNSLIFSKILELWNLDLQNELLDSEQILRMRGQTSQGE
ncbi:hypothetical protein GRAQ_00295 [Rahnella aquatilis CIP 78.65 = ATCC 33071]|jgi:hypothetical protein|uniref:Uncharacterized protein n=1 Tax=Rahnella aquatilis (strain ATCC 33071 / DSM 4594 / JCM 1683 / NBRC 105701 / NCIMB 13365 / CIP 78.65) TaxID=745277 RepID=H2J0Q0_RAHAC|nr:DUF5677 domain-containing protein [Rahnella aquatilis]AEX51142.1 hypothetical protein Rahaq2_1259 [Rahnella aquatilis CIP 78.65 = ATCC 33071]KFD17969.1 hypothetical protein GRAQ_00295 [Rahnella aquatilis CIP 78.65 = ATCC 33071]